MMNNDLVSVIMPAFNAEKYIAESIQSVISQTHLNWELIVINDGSTDNTASVIKQYQLKDARIRYIFQENSGQAKAKNAGIKISSGSYIAFLDADDLWLKEKLEVSLRLIKESHASLVFTNYYVFYNELNTGPVTKMAVGDNIFCGRDSIITFLNYNQVPNLTVLAKRDAVISVGDFIDIVVAEDYEMWLRMLNKGCVFQSISTPLSLYRMHDASITAKDRHATFEIIQIIKNFGQKNSAYSDVAKKIAGEKIKYWLYNGYNTTPKKFRLLIKQVFPFTLTAVFYILSYVFPITQLRKFVIRLY